MSENSLEFEVSKCLEQIHQALHFALEKLVSVLESHSIDYWIDFGTLLGSTRGEDFIPWDDDLDLTIFEKDLPSVIDLVNSELSEILIPSIPDENSPQATPLILKLKGTKVTTPALSDWGINSGDFFGLSIDIFTVFPTKTKSSFFLNTTQFVCRLKHRKRILNFAKIKLAKNASFRNKIISLIFKVIPTLVIEKLFCAAKKSLTSPDSDLYRYSLMTNFWRETIRRHDILPEKSALLRGLVCKIPNNRDVFLESHYGDNYMMPPAPIHRTTHNTKVSVDLNSPFMTFFEF